MNKANSLFIFVVGAVAGIAGTYFVMNKKCDQRIQEEIDSVKETLGYSSRANFGPIARDTVDVKRDQREYAEHASKYVKYSGCSKKEIKKKMEKDLADVPYVIAPDNFGDMPDYMEITLTYYADNVLADDMDNVVDDVAETVGLSSLEHFGEYEDDVVFVRNDARKADYEILRDARTYAEVVGHTVYGSRVEDE